MTAPQFSYERSPDGRTLTLRGELDEDAAQRLRSLLTDDRPEPVVELRVDLTGVDFLPSAAVGVLATAQAAARRRGGALTFVAATGSIAERVLTICGLAHLEA